MASRALDSYHIHKQEAEGVEGLYSAEFLHLMYSGTLLMVFTVSVCLSASTSLIYINLYRHAQKFVSRSYCVEYINHVV